MMITLYYDDYSLLSDQDINWQEILPIELMVIEIIAFFCKELNYIGNLVI